MWDKFLPTLHAAEDQLKIGLDQISDEEAKAIYSQLVAINTEMYWHYLEPYRVRLRLKFHEESRND